MRISVLIASVQAAEALCPEKINFNGVELRKTDEGHYKNKVGSIKLAQNPDDRTWMFVEDKKHSKLVSFDGHECVSNTTTWYNLGFYRSFSAVAAMRYREKPISIEEV